MARRHAPHAFLSVGLAAVFGALAASRTVSLGNGSRASTNAAIVQRTRALDRYEASLQQALARKTAAAAVGRRNRSGLGRAGAGRVPPAAADRDHEAPRRWHEHEFEYARGRGR